MKTELQIAKENVEAISQAHKDMLNVDWNNYIIKSREHKQTCQRFLDFLDEWFKIDSMDDLKDCGCDGCKCVKDKIADLKNAIKEYDKNGIQINKTT